MLEGGAQHHAGIVVEDLLGAVAVVHVEVDDGHAGKPARPRVGRGHGHVVEEAEPHRAVALGVMTGRTHQTEGRLASQCGLRCLDRRTGRTSGMHVDVWIERGIGIKMFARIRNAFDMLTRMRAQ